MRVVTAEQMRVLDRRAMDAGRIPGAVLMENAGSAVVAVMQQTLGRLAGRQVAIFCGGGNNGGDGAVIARYLHLHGARPTVLMLGDVGRSGPDARTHFEILHALQLPILTITAPAENDASTDDLFSGLEADVVVDALLGTGAKGAPRSAYAAAIRWINLWRETALKTDRGRQTAIRQESGSVGTVVAVDIPSGVDADTGETPGEAVQASITVTFAYPKAGHFLFPGAAKVGLLHVSDIGFDWEVLTADSEGGTLETKPVTPSNPSVSSEIMEGSHHARTEPPVAAQPHPQAGGAGSPLRLRGVSADRMQNGEPDSDKSIGEAISLRLFVMPGSKLIETGFHRPTTVIDRPVQKLLQKRYPDANKGDYGHVAILSGSRGMCGAPALVARAAQRVGAGLVTVLAPSSAQAALAIKLDEQMTLSLPEEEGAVCEAAFDIIAGFARKATVLCIGPGLTTKPGAVALVQRLIVEIDRPIVLDADGLNALAMRPEIALQRADNPLAPLVLTPHPGEAARLLGIGIPEIEADRIASVRRLATRYRAIALLKGAYTLIASAQGDILINTTGNPGMATGGSGDTLTGILGGLLARQTRLLEKAHPAHDIATIKQEEVVADTETVALGAHIHGLAADIAAQEIGETALVAGDIIAHLGRALRLLEEAN